MSRAGPAPGHRALLRRLHEAYGSQRWWPARSRFEVMVGAVLTQNTAWTNVERAIAELRKNGGLDARRLHAERPDRIARWIRPTGYFNVKARRLKALCRWYVEAGEHRRLRRWDTHALREALLGVKGVGRETADDILLYAFDRPVFVVDAYTRRLFARLGHIDGREGYETIRAQVEKRLGADVPALNEYHALIVRHAKDVCKVRPRCDDCCLKRRCPTGRQPRSTIAKR